MPKHHLRVGAVLVMATALLVLGLVSFVRRVDAERPEVGIDWAASSGGPFVVRIEPGSPADSSGLRVGDRLRRVDGHAVDNVLDAAELGWDARRDRPLRLEVLRGSRAVRIDVIPTWTPRSEPYGYLVIVGIAFWLSGLFIAVRWPGIRGGRVYAAMAFTLFAVLTLSATGRADPFDWFVFWVETVAVALTPALLLHVGVALSRRAVVRPTIALGAGYGVSAILVLGALWLSPATLGGAYRFADPTRVIEAWDRVGYLVLALSLLATATLLVKTYARTSSVLHRGQLRWMLWGLAVGLGPFVLLYAVPWSLGAAELPPWARFLAVVPMLIVPATFTAAIARYRLHDLDVLLIRAVSVVTSVFFTLAVYATTYFLLREGVMAWLPLSRGGARYIAILLAAVSFPKLRSVVRAAMERAFYRRRYSYRATLLDWARELTGETDLAALLRHLKTRVRVTLGVPSAAVLVKRSSWRFESLDTDGAPLTIDLDEASLGHLDGQSFLALEPGSLAAIPWARFVFPMKVKGELRALLVVAERDEHDEPLTTEDRALLITLAAHAGTAIENARLLREVRQRAEEIERLHARQATILESSAVGLLMLDGDGRVRAWNRTLESIFDVAADDALGRRLEELLPFHVANRVEREGERVLRTGTPRQFRTGVDDGRGDTRLINVAVSRAEDDSRVVTIDDVTARVRLEEQVLQQERLASLGMLAAGVAHEINTPLTGISSYTQMLLEEHGEERSREMLGKIEAQSRRASEIANSLLNLARPERSSFERLDLREAIEEVLRLFAPQLRGNGVRLDSRIESSLPPVRGHKGQLQQVLLNLLVNARDAIDGDGTIRVTAHGTGERAVIEVSDSGVGIPAEDLPRIFDPFFSTKTRGRGTGLGLSISYGIVQEHDGRIDVDSRQGEGTRFRIELPAERAAQAMA